MTVYRLPRAHLFPDPAEAEPSGLLAVGGDVSPERVLLAYANGIFPWYERPPILWFSPDPRGVLPLAPRSALHVPRRLARTLRQGLLRVSFDAAFEDVMRACATAPRDGQRGTWITDELADTYLALHARGFAHSCEAWHGARLVGGVFGIAIGDAFFADSMFHTARDASKVALVSLAQKLAADGYALVDCQLPTDHLETLGFESWPRARYLRELAKAVSGKRAPEKWASA
ncbi:MAG: leucyl/phenylalanyl-tRNA--protein transferase [Deltaproteobacteria bacterium]|nr:leucyl/phenylalanyl-tRNA--protein transferase [Deltaproteobacteria bacterium]